MGHIQSLFLRLLKIGFLISILFFPAQAEISYDAHTQVELVSETTSIRASEPFWVALRMKTDEKWHTYWQNPGDSGLPTKIIWTLPEGFSAGPIHWPYPKRIDSAGLTSYGYEDEVLLPAEITPPANIPQSAVVIKAQAEWLACEIPCIPGQADLSLTLPISETKPPLDPRWQPAFTRAREGLPIVDPHWRIGAFQNENNIQIRLYPRSYSNEIKHFEFFPNEGNLIVHSALQKFEFFNKEKFFSLTLLKDQRTGQIRPQRLHGVAVVYVNDQTVIKVLKVDVPLEDLSKDLLAAGEKGKQTSPLWLMLVFAFLGGVILNIMPCVFPVLSVKVLTFLSQAQDKKALIASSLSYASGIVMSFTLLSLILMILRQTGENIGWGFQFQSPYFVVAISLFLFVLALNLFGLFEWQLPLLLPVTPGTLKTGEAFLSGILVTVVATPCTAPFMGTALSFALTQTALVNMLIFVFLGLGMAAPFVVLCFFPSLLKCLPKPGPWMDQFKKFLGFPMLATVIWLLWVLGHQKGADTTIIVLIAFLLMSFGLWLKSLTEERKRSSSVIRILAFGCLMISFLWPIIQMKSSANVPNILEDKESGMGWIPYDKKLIDRLEEEEKILFFDFTAKWCLTCQVNERLVLNDPRVVKKFRESGVIVVKADWTNPNEDIALALEEFGKNSVPFYVMTFLKDGQRQKEILPEILTVKIVLESLEKVAHQR